MSSKSFKSNTDFIFWYYLACFWSCKIKSDHNTSSKGWMPYIWKLKSNPTLIKNTETSLINLVD